MLERLCGPGPACPPCPEAPRPSPFCAQDMAQPTEHATYRAFIMPQQVVTGQMGPTSTASLLLQSPRRHPCQLSRRALCEPLSPGPHRCPQDAHTLWSGRLACPSTCGAAVSFAAPSRCGSAPLIFSEHGLQPAPDLARVPYCSVPLVRRALCEPISLITEAHESAADGGHTDG